MAYINFLPVTIAIGFADLVALPCFPYRSFRHDNERIIAGIVPLVLHQKIDGTLEIERIFRNQAPGRSYVGGVESRETGVAAEDAENADPFVGPERGALPGDRVLRARDRRRKPDAVFGALDVVVHRLRNRQ